MKIHDKQDVCHFVLPEYGKRKLLSYAESLEDLAESYSFMGNEDSKESRQEAIMHQKLTENKSIVAKQLKEISRLLGELAGEAYFTTYHMEKHKKQIYKILGENGLDVQDIYVVENKNGYMEIGLTLRAMYHDTYLAAQIGEFLSKLCHNKMELEKDCVLYVGDEPVTLVFKEEVRYSVLSGVAKAIKEGEAFSGDNHTLKEYHYGNFVGAISDGMGSGAGACRDSQQLIELLEKLLEAGFSLESTAEMLNDLLLIQTEGTRTATLDVCEINLYSGHSTFIKAGAAASYIKRGKYVKRILENTLPLGLFSDARQSRKTIDLKEGDYVILLSDGVQDCFLEEENKEYLEDRIGMMHYENPKEMANRILGLAMKKSRGRILDDMTVVVMGVIEKR